ncbi:MAG: DUF1326 domain-containing protein [Actinomycetota bacterium]|nr:DUF1326 domain-containing protein [Actinomycetota bacterium]
MPDPAMIGPNKGSEEGLMATDWYMEGAWFKNCNCDPGCPCDFNQFPTHDHCEGMVAMRIGKGTFGDVDLSGLNWAAIVQWPGAMHEGNGTVVPIVDERADESQREALLQIMSGQQGDTLFEIIAAVCPNVKEPQFVPFEFEFDLDSRTGRVTAGEVLETEVDTMRGIDPPDPYRVLVRIPGGFEYTGPDEEAETAQATKIVAKGDVEFSLENSHSSMAFVRHGNQFQEKYTPTVVESAR